MDIQEQIQIFMNSRYFETLMHRMQELASIAFDEEDYDRFQFQVVEQTDFMIAPASAKYHGNHWGGLVEHILGVYEGLQLMKPRSQLTDREMARLAIFHDFCKINYYEPYIYRGELKFRVNDQFPVGHGAKSVIMALRWGFELTDKEIIAIRWHMGEFDNFYGYKSQRPYIEKVDFQHHWLQLADQMASWEESGK